MQDRRHCHSRRRLLEGHPLQIRLKQDWGRGYIFLLPQTAVCPDQMLAVMFLRYSEFRHRKPLDLVFHVVFDLWSTLLEHGLRFVQQFGEEARPHLWINKCNRPTPVLRRLNLTQAVRGKLI